MSAAEGKTARKQAYFTKLLQLLEEYPKILIVGADNVGSNHMQKIRMALRGKGVLLMGKNTMIRKAIRSYQQQNEHIESIVPYVYGNVGFIFAKGDLSEIKKVVSENRVSAPAKAGSVSPINVIVPAGPTGMEPTQTSFLQALNIASKITKGQIEITNDVLLVKQGEKVGSSEATLLAKLDIKPFTYGLTSVVVYDSGSIYEPKVLDLTDADILAKFNSGVKNVACVSLQIGYPTVASLPHSISRGFKNVLAIALATDYSFPIADKFKNAAKAAPAAAAPVAASGKKDAAPAKEEKKKEEPKEEEDDDMGFGLFD